MALTKVRTNFSLEKGLRIPAKRYAKDKRTNLSVLLNELLEKKLVAAGYLPSPEKSSK